MFTYEATNYDITWLTANLSEGWGEDTFLTISHNSPTNSYTIGADGKMTVHKGADRSVTITMNFTQAAKGTLDQIYKVYAAQDIIGATVPFAPFLVRDRSENGLKGIPFVCTNAVLMEKPEINFGKQASEQTLTWVAETCIMGDDISSITSQLADYIK